MKIKTFFITFFLLLIHHTFSQTISEKNALKDLQSLQEILEQQHAYLWQKNYNYQNHLDLIRKSLKDKNDLKKFAEDIKNLLSKFGDSHAEILMPKDIFLEPSGFLSFYVAKQGQNVVAISPRRNMLLNPNYPYLKSINNISLEKLFKTSGKIYQYSSQSLFHQKAIDNLIFIKYILEQNKAFKGKRLSIKLSNQKTDTLIHLNISGKTIFYYEDKLIRNSRVLEGNIAYLNIEEMYAKEDYEFERIIKFLENNRVKNSKGLIIDLRNNDGGLRDLMMDILPLFMKEKYFIANISFPRNDNNGMKERYLFPVKSEKWSLEEREFIDDFLEHFKPEYNFPKEKFLEEHITLIKKQNDKFYPNKDIIVLLNEKSFAATDVFLSALKTLPNVTLMGTTSAGGSGRKRTFVLKKSGIEIKLSTMLSFQSNGRLFHQNGIAPDIKMLPTSDDLLGKSDSILEKARLFLLEK